MNICLFSFIEHKIIQSPCNSSLESMTAYVVVTEFKGFGDILSLFHLLFGDICVVVLSRYTRGITLDREFKIDFAKMWQFSRWHSNVLFSRFYFAQQGGKKVKVWTTRGTTMTALTTEIVDFDDRKSSNVIINNATMSDDEVVASYGPPRSLFL